MGFVGLFLAITFANLVTELVMDDDRHDDIGTGKFIALTASILLVLAVYGELTR